MGGKREGKWPRKTEKAFKRELGGLGFTPKASPENGGGVKEEVPAGRLQQDSE